MAADTPTTQWGSTLQSLLGPNNNPTTQWAAVLDIPPGTRKGVNNTFVTMWGAVILTDIIAPANLTLQIVYMVGADTDGDVQMINVGKSDNSSSIFFELETQDIECGNRSHLKSISDQIMVLTQFGQDSSLSVRSEDGDYESVPIDLSRRVNIGQAINVEGKYFGFKWFGNSKTSSPILEGFKIDNITDKGLTNK